MFKRMEVVCRTFPRSSGLSGAAIPPGLASMWQLGSGLSAKVLATEPQHLPQKKIDLRNHQESVLTCSDLQKSPTCCPSPWEPEPMTFWHLEWPESLWVTLTSGHLTIYIVSCIVFLISPREIHSVRRCQKSGVQCAVSAPCTRINTHHPSLLTFSQTVRSSSQALADWSFNDNMTIRRRLYQHRKKVRSLWVINIIHILYNYIIIYIYIYGILNTDWYKHHLSFKPRLTLSQFVIQAAVGVELICNEHGPLLSPTGSSQTMDLPHCCRQWSRWPHLRTQLWHDIWTLWGNSDMWWQHVTYCDYPAANLRQWPGTSTTMTSEKRSDTSPSSSVTHGQSPRHWVLWFQSWLLRWLPFSSHHGRHSGHCSQRGS